MEASVWTQPLIGRPATPCTSRPTAAYNALRQGRVQPKGIADGKTDWPTSNSEEEPTVMGLNTLCWRARTFSDDVKFKFKIYAEGSAPTSVAS